MAKLSKKTKLKRSNRPPKAEESFLDSLRRRVEDQYSDHPTGCGGSFDEILCFELHDGGEYDEHGKCTFKSGLTFIWLAEKWGIPVSILGELICDHCKKLAPQLTVNHGYRR